MESKYISINLLENLIKETKFKTVKNLCRKAINNMINQQKDEPNKNRLFILYENDKLYKFIKE